MMVQNVGLSHSSDSTDSGWCAGKAADVPSPFARGPQISGTMLALALTSLAAAIVVVVVVYGLGSGY